MKRSYLDVRKNPDRPRTTVSISLPDDVIEDLKSVALRLGVRGYLPLIQSYIGKGLREDFAELHAHPERDQLAESLRKSGMAEDLIVDALYEARHAGPKPNPE